MCCELKHFLFPDTRVIASHVPRNTLLNKRARRARRIFKTETRHIIMSHEFCDPPKPL